MSSTTSGFLARSTSVRSSATASSSRRFRFALGALAITSAATVLPANIRYSTTFNDTNPWPSAFRQTSANIGVPSSGQVATIGTYDLAGNDTRTSAFRLAFTTPASGTWNASVRSNRIAVAPSTFGNEYLTLSFDLWATSTAPVKIAIFTYTDATSVATGKLVTTVYPPVANAYYRHTIDLNEMTAEWGSPNPRLGLVEFGFETANPGAGSAGWPYSTANSLRVDNLSFTEPRYFVRPDGDNGGSGTLQQPLRTIGEAISRATPGDVICLLTGTYGHE